MDKNKFLQLIKDISYQTMHTQYHIEKDYYLDYLLSTISKDDVLSELLIFKGGTCLSKGYFDYYRMSEDLDFSVNYDTDKNPYSMKDFFNLGRSAKQNIRSKIINLLVERFLSIIYSKEFKFLNIIEVNHEYCMKNGDDYASCLKQKLKHNESKLLRLTILYKSVITGKDEKILIEVGVGSEYWFKPNYIELKSLFEIVEPIKILSHDIRQIFAEKFSAMTDRSYHERRIAIRDYFDIQFLYPIIKNNLNEIIPIIGLIYINDFNHKKGIEGFIHIKGILDFEYDYDFIIDEIFNQEAELLQPAPRESIQFLNENNINFLYDNIYLPIQESVKDYLGIDRKIHLTDGLMNKITD